MHKRRVNSNGEETMGPIGPITPPADCLLPTASCLLPPAYCLLPPAYCLLNRYPSPHGSDSFDEDCTAYPSSMNWYAVVSSPASSQTLLQYVHVSTVSASMLPKARRSIWYWQPGHFAENVVLPQPDPIFEIVRRCSSCFTTVCPLCRSTESSPASNQTPAQ